MILIAIDDIYELLQDRVPNYVTVENYVVSVKLHLEFLLMS